MVRTLILIFLAELNELLHTFFVVDLIVFFWIKRSRKYKLFHPMLNFRISIKIVHFLSHFIKLFYFSPQLYKFWVLKDWLSFIMNLPFAYFYEFLYYYNLLYPFFTLFLDSIHKCVEVNLHYELHTDRSRLII